MKKIFITIIIGLSLLACKSDDEQLNNNNPYLTIPVVNLNLNLNLPEYSSLKFPGNSVEITNQGVKGIVVYCVNDNFYTAFELSDPNHNPSSCSRMGVIAPIATCTCDDENSYNIISGEHESQDNSKYPMQQYRTERSGDIVRVYN